MPMTKDDNFVGGDGREHGKLFTATVIDGNWRHRWMKWASAHWILNCQAGLHVFNNDVVSNTQHWRKPAHTWCSMLKKVPIAKWYLMLSMSSLLFAVPKEPFCVSCTTKWTACLQEVSPFQCSNTNSLVNLPVPWPPSQISTIFLTVTSDRGCGYLLDDLGFANHDQPSAPAFAIRNTHTTQAKSKQKTKQRQGHKTTTIATVISLPPKTKKQLL